MRSPHTMYPILGPSPVLTTNGESRFLHAVTSLPSHVGTLIQFETKPFLHMPTGDVTHRLAQIPFDKKGVPLHGVIQFDPWIRLTDSQRQGLDNFSAKLDVPYIYNCATGDSIADTIMVFDPTKERSILTLTPHQEVLEFERVTNQAIILGAVRSLAMQSEVGVFPL